MLRQLLLLRVCVFLVALRGSGQSSSEQRSCCRHLFLRVGSDWTSWDEVSPVVFRVRYSTLLPNSHIFTVNQLCGLRHQLTYFISL